MREDLFSTDVLQVITSVHGSIATANTILHIGRSREN
jgi:hypothetical protein